MTTVRDGAIAKVVAEKALEVTDKIVADMDEATRTGQTSHVVSNAVEVYRGIAKYVTSQVDDDRDETDVEATEDVSSLKSQLKRSADKFCDALTTNSAPDAAPVSSSSSDFLFNCQKVQQRVRRESTRARYQASSA